MKNLATIIFYFLSFCSFSQDTTVVSYFNEITSGSEYSSHKTKLKFTKDVYVFVYGNCDEELKTEVVKVIKELNDLIDPIEIYLTNDESKANVKMYFGKPSEYVKINPFSESFIENSWGLFFLFPKNNSIDLSLVFVDTERSWNNSQRKHVLREELTQSLGFGNDSFTYPDSIFYQGWTEVHEYSELDKEVIKMLYN